MEVLIFVAIIGGFAYYKVPAFKDFVDGIIAKLKSKAD